MSAHTSGPWNLRADPDDRDAWIIVDASHSSFRVCDVAPRFEAKEELSNARLIAAAPEMAELLVRIGNVSMSFYPLCRAVLEKAGYVFADSQAQRGTAK